MISFCKLLTQSPRAAFRGVWRPQDGRSQLEAYHTTGHIFRDRALNPRRLWYDHVRDVHGRASVSVKCIWEIPVIGNEPIALDKEVQSEILEPKR